MLFSLVQKDFILAKHYWPIMLVFAIGAPIFLNHSLDINSGGFLEFFITIFFTLHLLFNSVSLAEDKYKGATLLCTTPYTRTSLVQAKYLFVLAVFAGGYILYTITAVFAPIDMMMPNLSVLGIALLVITIFFGFLIPAQYRFGYEKTKYIFMFFVFISPFVIPLFVRWMQTNDILPITLPFPALIQTLLLYLLALAIGYASMRISVRIYSQRICNRERLRYNN